MSSFFHSESKFKGQRVLSKTAGTQTSLGSAKTDLVIASQCISSSLTFEVLALAELGPWI